MSYVDSIEALEERILRHKRLYYSGLAEISDPEYNSLESELRARRPGSLALQQIQFDPQAAVNLPHYVGSLEKVYAEDIHRLAGYDLGDLCTLHPKFDGYALLAGWGEDGCLRGLYTRDGFKGKDKSYLVPVLGIPTYLERAATSRRFHFLVLEMVMPISTFEAKYAKDYANPRNILGSIATSKSISPMVRDVHLIGHHWILPRPELLTENIGTIQKAPILGTLARPGLNVEDLSALLARSREVLDYEIDGVVIKAAQLGDHDFPQGEDAKFMVAFKENTQFAEAVVESDQWEPTAFGRIFPTLKIKPVKLGGVKITNVTAHHAKFVYDNKIGEGTRILITRGGDVIPKIERVIEALGEPFTAPKYLDPVWDGVHLKIGPKAEGTVDSVKIRRIYHFFKVIGIETMAESTIERLYGAGINTLPKILTSTPTDFAGLRGVKDKMARNMHEAIQSGVKGATLSGLMIASAEFQGLGTKIVDRILDQLGTHTYEQLVVWSQKQEFNWIHRDWLWHQVTKTFGVGDELGRIFVDGLPAFFKFHDEVGQLVQMAEVKKIEAESTKLAGKQFVLTGFRDDDLEMLIRVNGGAVGSGVSKKTSYLIAENATSGSSKAKKARELGIPIITQADAREMCQSPTD